MNINISVTPVAGPVSVEFDNDFVDDIAFLAPGTNDVVVDCTGENALHMSELLASLPPDALMGVVRERVVELVKLARGIA